MEHRLALVLSSTLTECYGTGTVLQCTVPKSVPTASDDSRSLIPRCGARTGGFPILFNPIILLVGPAISGLHPLPLALLQLIVMLWLMILLGSGLHAITHGDDGQTNAVGTARYRRRRPYLRVAEREQ